MMMMSSCSLCVCDGAMDHHHHQPDRSNSGHHHPFFPIFLIEFNNDQQYTYTLWKRFILRDQTSG